MTNTLETANFVEVPKQYMHKTCIYNTELMTPLLNAKAYDVETSIKLAVDKTRKRRCTPLHVPFEYEDVVDVRHLGKFASYRGSERMQFSLDEPIISAAFIQPIDMTSTQPTVFCIMTSRDVPDDCEYYACVINRKTKKLISIDDANKFVRITSSIHTFSCVNKFELTHIEDWDLYIAKVVPFKRSALVDHFSFSNDRKTIYIHRTDGHDEEISGITHISGLKENVHQFFLVHIEPNEYTQCTLKLPVVKCVNISHTCTMFDIIRSVRS